MMDGMSNARRAGLAVLALAVPLLAACGAATPTAGGEQVPLVVDNLSVVADGRLVPVESAQLSFTAGGEVVAVLVQEGDQVRAGQALVRLGDAEQVQAAVAGAELELVSAQQALDALYENAQVMAAQAQQAVADARDALRVANYTWSVQQEGNRASQSAINGAEANLLLAERHLDDARDEYGQFSGHSSDDPARALAQKNLSNAQRDYDSALRNLNWLTGKPTDIQQALLDAHVAVAEANLAAAEQAWADLQDGPDPEAVALGEARLNNAEAQLAAARAALSNLELAAPFDGTVSAVMAKVGEMASPGQPAVVLADYSGWVVETENLTEIELPKIGLGQPVTVSFDALEQVELPGTVTAMRPLYQIRQGDVVYTVKIELAEADPRLQWGMTAVVTFEDRSAAGLIDAGRVRSLGH